MIYDAILIIDWLVVEHPSEKYARQLGLLSPMYGKITAMFQTTNQNTYY